MTEEFEKVKCEICGEVMGADKAAAHEKETGHELWAIVGLIPTDTREQVARILLTSKTHYPEQADQGEIHYSFNAMFLNEVVEEIHALYTPLIEQARQEVNDPANPTHKAIYQDGVEDGKEIGRQEERKAWMLQLERYANDFTLMASGHIQFTLTPKEWQALKYGDKPEKDHTTINYVRYADQILSLIHPELKALKKEELLRLNQQWEEEYEGTEMLVSDWELKRWELIAKAQRDADQLALDNGEK